MKTLNIAYTKTFTDSTLSSTEKRIDVVKGAMNECVIKPIFGENNNLISNAKYLDSFSETSGSNNYFVFSFDVGGLLFSLSFKIITTHNNTTDLRLSIRNDNNTVLTEFTGEYRYNVSSNNTSATATVIFNLPYLIRDEELKAMWCPYYNTFKEGVIVLDSIDTFDTETEINTIGTMGSKVMFYRTTSDTQNSIDTTNRAFSYDDKVLMERVLYSESDVIVGFLTNIIKIYNSTLGTSSLTAEGSYFKKIDVDGVKYRQIAGCYWIEDKD